MYIKADRVSEISVSFLTTEPEKIKVAMIGSLVLGFLLVPLIIVQSDMPSVLRQGPSKSSGEKFWSMSMNQPIKKELDQDLDILLGRIEDFDPASLRSGNFEKLPNGQVAIKNPTDSFFRRQRSATIKVCNIPIKTVEMKQGRCIRLRDNTPACQNEQYMAVNYEDCNE